MRVLILKVSSLGDVIHTFPAITDAARARPDIRFDWVIDESYVDVVRWHPAVDRLVVFPHRRWRRQPGRAVFGGEIVRLIRDLRSERYDLIIDAQGQVGNTAWLALLARGRRSGFDWASIREPLASLVYQQKFHIPTGQHAVERLRQLFARSLSYELPGAKGEYGIDREARFATRIEPRRLMFLHGTSWITKEWPEEYWEALVDIAGREQHTVQMTWGTQLERQRAERLARGRTHVTVLNRMNVTELASRIAACSGIVATDTGLGHVAAALSVPTVSLYGPTSSRLTGAYGESQRYLQSEFTCAPCLQKQCTYTGSSDVLPACFQELSPDRVWHELKQLLDKSTDNARPKN